MCRNIRPLFNFEPPATDAEVREASLQFVRKLSGFSRPSQVNEEVFELAVARVSEAARQLIDALVTAAPPKDRERQALARKLRSARRFSRA